MHWQGLLCGVFAPVEGRVVGEVFVHLKAYMDRCHSYGCGTQWHISAMNRGSGTGFDSSPGNLHRGNDVVSGSAQSHDGWCEGDSAWHTDFDIEWVSSTVPITFRDPWDWSTHKSPWNK